ncbi:hypothetical protein AM588_10011289 [Phytophthora nicotianae]|uniref:Conserved oligomeric Golgi complex subunit 1 n=1 Tax=Phytophthora nicotianae TaxID=4792 RepID=A0A0W8DS96_PHYNI|nr:hypothetical protein AM588_10011289 [Phytophthora nicotianae]
MTPAATRGAEHAGDAADFLRRLSVADAKVLLERTRKEKETKTKEMQKMIGVRYRDLIESADKIVNMHSAALRLEVSLKEMPDMWKHMELSLGGALAEILGNGEKTQACFIDEELGRVNAVGFHSLYLVSEIKQKASYPQLFVNVLHRLSKKYCEAWATILLEQKIEPLRELLLVEQYDSTNEEWIATHEGWIEQVISDEVLDGDTDGSSSESEMAFGDEKLNPEDCSPGLLKLKSLFERMREFIDPVDWEIYGPQLIENVVLQFRKSRLLFSSLSESNDINKINGKEIVIGAQDTRPLARIAEPVARFSLLPVPSSRRKFQRTMSSTSRSSENDIAEGRSRANSSTLFHERTDDASQSSTTKLQNLLSSSTSSNLFSAATSGTNLLSSAAKGIGFLSSATTNKYF